MPLKTREVTRDGPHPIPDDAASQEPWRADLNPDLMAGQNAGAAGPHPEKAAGVKTAYDIKDLHDRLQKFHDDDLKQVPILPEGTRLEQGETYIDLRSPHPRKFTARAGMVAEPANRYVPKTEVPYQIWNRLTGVTDPERLRLADEP
jgi:hypothetical protein